MADYIPKNPKKEAGNIKSMVIYLAVTLILLLLCGSFVSDNVYSSASNVTTDQAGVSLEYRAAIGDGFYSQLTGADLSE